MQTYILKGQLNKRAWKNIGNKDSINGIALQKIEFKLRENMRYFLPIYCEKINFGDNIDREQKSY